MRSEEDKRASGGAVRRLIRNGLSAWGAMALSGVTSVFITPFIIGRMGLEGYGWTVLLLLVTSLPSIVDFGFRAALQRELTEFVSRRDDPGYTELLSGALFTFGVGGLVLAAGFLALAPQGLAWMAPDASVPPVATFGWCGVVLILCAFLEAPPSAVLGSHERFDLAALAGSLAHVLYAVASVCLLSWTELGFAAWAMATVIAEILRVGLLFGMSMTMKPTVRVRLSRVRLRALANVSSLGGYMFCSQLARVLGSNVDSLLLGAILGPGSLSLYRPAASLSALAQRPIQAICSQLGPWATSLYAQGNREALRQMLVRGTRYVFALGLPTSAFFGVFCFDICRLWLGGALGEGYKEVAKALLVLAVIEFVGCASGTQWPVLLAAGRLEYGRFLDLPLAVVNLLASAVLLATTSLGVLGVLLPTLVVELVRRPILIRHTARICEVPVWEYVCGAYLAPLLVGGALVVGALGLRLLIAPDSLLKLVTCGALVSLLWAVLCWIVASGAERTQLRREFQACLGKSVDLGTT